MRNKFFRNQKDQKLQKTLCAAILMVFALLLASCSIISGRVEDRVNQAQQQSREIQVPVTRGSVSSSMSFVGNLRYNQSSALSWKTDGVIEKVYVKVGDKVKKGDILAELAADSLSSNVLLAEKNMIELRERLEDVMDSTTAQMAAYSTLNAKDIALQKAKLEQEALYYPRATREEMERAWDKYALANLNFNYAKQDYDYLDSINEPWEGSEEPRDVIMFGRLVHFGGDDRSGRQRKFEDYVSTYNTLVSAYETYEWTSGRPSDVDYAVAEGNVAVAQMEYDKALEDYLSYSEMPREKDVTAIELSLENAETIYNWRFITAPFDGVVTSVNAVESYYVKRGTEALRIDDTDRLYIPIYVPELDLSALTVNTPVSIVVDAYYGKTYSGQIYSIADSSTPTGTMTSFNALVSIDDPDSGLLAGMTAEVSVPVKEKTNVLLIPNSAISYSDGKPSVTVVNGNRRNTVEITIGTMTGNVTEVTSENLKEGDLLVTESITAAALRELGLDPAQYMPDSGRSGAGAEGNIQRPPDGSGENRRSRPDTDENNE